jgi:hypothetical protein
MAGEPSFSQPQEASLAIPCDLALPGSLTNALVCSDNATASQQLFKLDCVGSRAPEVMEVRQVWGSRGSLPAVSAARDIVVQALMAKCLVAASLDQNSPEVVDPSELSFLRGAVRNPNPGVSVIAMMGLAPVLTKDDIASIVEIASTHETLALPAVMTLSASCLAEAHLGIASIRTAYPGPLSSDIDKFMAEPLVQDQSDVCSGKKARVPQSVIAKAMNLPPVTEFHKQSSNAIQVKAALESPDPKRALQVLLDLSCNAENSDAIGEMRQAWRDRHSPAATETVRDPVIQAVIARCLIEVDARLQSDRVEIADATTVLRSALHGDDVMGVLAAVEGLAILNSDQDVKDIADVPHRMPGALNAVVRIVGFTCGNNNLKTIAAIRKAAATRQLRDRIDAVYKHAEAGRNEQCGESKMKINKE